MSTFSDRLKELMELKIGDRRANTAFAALVGISEGSIRQYLKGDTLPRVDGLVQIARATGVFVEWLATGEGPRDLASEIGQSVGTQPEQGAGPMLQIVDRDHLDDSALVLLPRLDVRLSAGPGALPNGENVRDFAAFEVSYLKAAGINPTAAKLVEIEGRSMMPTLVDGEWVIVDLSATNIVNGMIYAVLYKEALLVKRVRRDGPAVVLVSDNTAEGYGDERVAGADLEDLSIIGRVKRHIRSL